MRSFECECVVECQLNVSIFATDGYKTDCLKCVVMKIHFIKLVGRRGRCNDRTLFYKLRVL